jgi:hypothetical protein
MTDHCLSRSLLAALLVLAACQARPPDQPEAEKQPCSPTYLRVPADQSECSVWVGATFEFGFKVAVVGCSDDLASVEDSEVALIQSTVERLVSEVNFRVLLIHRDQALRQMFSAEINDSLGRKVATDVLVFDVHTGESDIP